MHDLTVLKFPDKRLRKKASRVSGVGEHERTVLSRMADTMYLNNGVGLAAIQVGIDSQLIVIDIGNGLMKFVNPVIIRRAGSDAQEEGCLSVPGVCVKVRRAKTIHVNYLNELGDAVKLKAESLLARAIQHEMDHLNGKLITDYLNPIKKIIVSKTRIGLDKSGVA